MGVASRCPEARTTASTRSGAPSARCTTCRAPSSVSPTARVRCRCTRIPSGRRDTTSRSTQPRYSLCRRRLGNVLAVTAASSSRSSSGTFGPVCAQSQNVGPSTTGPSQTTESSVYIVTSAAIEFIASRGDCSWRQIRPAPGGYGSIRCTSRAPGASSGTPAARRSRMPVPRGPAPTMAMLLAAGMGSSRRRAGQLRRGGRAAWVRHRSTCHRRTRNRPTAPG